MTPRQRGALIAILVLAVVVFGWALTSIPAEVHGDDAEVGLDAIRLLESFNLFAAGWFELPRFHALPTAISLRLFGATLLGLRMTSAVLGVAGVLLLFAVVRRLWSADLALLAALLLIGQRFWIHLSRAGYHYVDTPVFSLLVIWLLLRLWQDGRLGAALWCGIALGLGIQTYYASRLVPPLLVLTWLAWLPETPRGQRRARVLQLVVVGVTALAVAAPLFGYFAHHWADFWERTRDTSMFTPAARHHLAYGYGSDSLGVILAIQLRAALSLFNLTGDNSVQYGYGAPLLDPVSGALFVLGTGLAILGLRQRRLRLVVLWTVLPLIAGAALTVDTPFYPRISGLVPFAVLLVALALWQMRAALAAALPRPYRRWAIATVLGAATALILAINWRTYFVDYAPTYRHSPAVEIADFVNRHGSGRTTYMIGGAPAFFIHHGTISYLTWGKDTQDVLDLEALLKKGRLDPRRSAFVIMPQGLGLVDRLQQAVGPLQVQTHRSKGGDVAFLGAVPVIAGDPMDPPDALKQAAELSPAGHVLDRVLGLVQRVAPWILAAALAAAVLAAAWLAWRQPPLPGIAALREPIGERVARWRTSLVGPDAREPMFAPPRAAVAALLVIVLAAALGLRVYRLTELPAGFFCDEAGNGFNTACLLYSGRDETGAHLPLYVWSFGTSYKNPAFVYSAMLPMAVLGPTEMAVRLTAALWGFATVLAMFFLGRALMGSLVGLAAALLLAVCPWHLHFSRIGFELIAMPLFFTCALTCLVRWTQGRRTLGQAAILLGLCLYTYVPAKLFVPLFTAGFALLYWRALRARWRETAVAVGLLAVTVAPVAIFDLAHRDLAGSYFERTTLLGYDASPPAMARLFAENYTEFFSSEFLFRASNDRIIRHRVGDHGELYPFMAPLLVLGVLVAILRRDRALRLPLLWLALYPVAAALLNEIPSASRGFIGAPAFCLVAAIGVGGVLRLARVVSDRRTVVWAVQGGLLAAGLLVLVPAARAYWRLYSEDYPLYSAKEYTGFQFGHRRVLEVFKERYDDFDLELLTTRRSNQPDVFLRFYDGLQQPMRPDQVPPFEHRDKMIASSPEARDHYVTPGRRILFAVLPEEVPLFADPHVIERVFAPDGSAAFVLVAATRLKDFVSTWRVGGLFPEGDTSPPPTWTPEDAPDEDPPGIQWRLHDQLFAGVGLNDFFVPNADHACAWAMNFVTTDVDRDLRVFVGFDDTGEVWVNGARVTLKPVADPDHTLVDALTGELHLNAGRNAIAVRACEDTGDWRFYFRLENLDRTPVEGLSLGLRAGAVAGVARRRIS